MSYIAASGHSIVIVGWSAHRHAWATSAQPPQNSSTCTTGLEVGPRHVCFRHVLIGSTRTKGAAKRMHQGAGLSHMLKQACSRQRTITQQQAEGAPWRDAPTACSSYYGAMACQPGAHGKCEPSLPTSPPKTCGTEEGQASPSQFLPVPQRVPHQSAPPNVVMSESTLRINTTMLYEAEVLLRVQMHGANGSPVHACLAYA